MDDLTSSAMIIISIFVGCAFVGTLFAIWFEKLLDCIYRKINGNRR